MRLVTHPNFRSLNPFVKDAETVDEYLEEALFYQDNFDKRTTPWEAQQWDPEALREFMINLEKIDRLYYICHENDCVGYRTIMVARMEFEDYQYYYVQLAASYNNKNSCYLDWGSIFISKDANIFMKLVLAELQEDFNKDPIYASLREDSIYVEEEDNTRFDKLSRMKWKNTPKLKYFCHEVIYQNSDTFREYRSLLPKMLTESIDNFIRTKEARIAYENYE